MRIRDARLGNPVGEGFDWRDPMKLNAGAFAVAFGLWWGGGLFIATWWLIAIGGITGELTIIEQFYPGFSFTPVGSFIGLAWGLVCGAICGGILALLYNFFAGLSAVPAGQPVGKTT